MFTSCLHHVNIFIKNVCNFSENVNIMYELTMF